MSYSRRHQHDLNITQPVSVLWAALKAALPAEDVRRVEAAYKAQSRRYQRACELNKRARWVERAGSVGRVLIAEERERLEKWRAILADPLAYIEGE